MKTQELTSILAATLEPVIVNAFNEALPKALAGITNRPVKTEEEGYEGIELPMELFHCARQTVYTNIDKIPHYKRGKRLFFKRSELLECIRNGRK